MPFMLAFSLSPMHSKGLACKLGGRGEQHCEAGGVRWEVRIWTKKGADDVELQPEKKKSGNLTYGPPTKGNFARCSRQC
jgi:hypothetical protein